MSTTDHKIKVLREILRPNEIQIVQYIMMHNDESEGISKAKIVAHLDDVLDAEDAPYHIIRLEKFKVVQGVFREVNGVSETFYRLHPEIEDFVVDFLKILFPGDAEGGNDASAQSSA